MGSTIFKLIKSKLAPHNISNSRQRICNTCPHRLPGVNQCKKCGCFLFFKTKLLYSSCPLGYWGNPTNTWGGR